MILPGRAPTYVLLWPRISASSWMPPKETLMNLQPRALAIDFPMEVLPTPGGPTKQRIGPLIFPDEFGDHKILDIFFFSLGEPVVISVKNFGGKGYMGNF